MQYKFENVVCTNVVDGDTIDVEIDFGFKLKQVVRLRLNRINTPEVRGKEREQGLKAKAYVRALILDEPIRIETFKKGKYGRYLAEIFIPSDNRCILDRNINDELVLKGLAEYKQY